MAFPNEKPWGKFPIEEWRNMLKTARISPSKKTVGVVQLVRVGILVQLALLFVLEATPWAEGQQYRLQRLSPPGSTYSFAFGLNNSGVIVGSFVNADSAYEGFAYKNGIYKKIVFPGSLAFTQASGVNDVDTVVGDFVGADQHTHGFLLTRDGKFTQYDVAGGVSTYVYGINNAGSLAGFVGNDGADQAFVNVGGTVTQFTVNGNPTVALGIDSSNNTVGQFVDTSFVVHGFYRDAGGVITQVDYPGATNTSCQGINDLRVITGYYTDVAGAAHGFAEKNGKFRTGPIPSVSGINNGEIFVGSYIGRNLQNYGYVAKPISPAQTR
jgi:hypothetical protein